MSRKIEVSIIIVHFGKYELVEKCLNSIYRSKPGVGFEVIVIDNNKNSIESRILKCFPKVNYIKSDKNIGYGAANNIGARVARGKFLLILNPDTEIFENTVDRLSGFLNRHKNAAVVSPNFYHEDGKMYEYQGSRLLTPLSAIFALSFVNKYFPNNPISRKYYLKDMDFSKEREVESVPGSCFMIRKKDFDNVGGFDENIFLFFEEADLFKRIRNGKREIFMIPEAKVIHYHKKSTPKISEIKKIFEKSRCYYFRKHFGKHKAAVVETILRNDPLFVLRSRD